MDLNILRTFVSVVQKQNMSEAADSLGYAKATVSVQMASLQKEFGCQIFMRSVLQPQNIDARWIY